MPVALVGIVVVSAAWTCTRPNGHKDMHARANSGATLARRMLAPAIMPIWTPVLQEEVGRRTCRPEQNT